MPTKLRLPNASSVVNYLDTKGKDSSYNARKKQYTDMGLSRRLGDYVGSESQNNAFLKSLQQADAPKIVEPTMTARDIAPNIPRTQFPATTARSVATAPAATPSVIPSPTSPSAAGILAGAGVPDFSRYKDVTPQAPKELKAPSGATISVGPAGEVSGQGTDDEVTSAQYDAQTAQQFGLSASNILPDFNPSEADLINDFLTSEEGSLLSERVRLGELNAEAAAEEARATLESKYAGDLTSLENNLAESGLAFSGIRTTQLKALADNLAASNLGVDREFASKLLDADLDLREGILKGVAEIVKAAEKKDDEAIRQLNAVGLAVINGQLVPTLSSQAAMRSERQLEMSERRLELSEAASARAEALFGKAFTSLTESEKKAAAAVELYRDDVIKPILQGGLTPQQALTAANEASLLTGIVLDTQQQSAILKEANRLLETGEVTPSPKAAQQPSQGFFSRLFGK